MRMTKLAFLNFKNSAKNFLALIFSLTFTVTIFFNFQNMIFSDALSRLGEQNKEYIDMLTQVLSFVIGVFLFFFIWYATNVFLTRRKKEIGTYVFMGLSNQKIGKMYLIESMLIGLTALVLGLALGALTTGLFQMILLAISELAVDIQFSMKPQPFLVTAGMYLTVYFIFVLKGYINIVRSSVLDMISAAKQNEYVKQKNWVLVIKTILGCGILGAGYYMALKDAGQEALGNMLIAVILVVAGVYLLFGGLIPFVFQCLIRQKWFLYQKQRNLWMNQMVFRMKKNYRTYAMVCVLTLSAVTALAAGFAMKNRYENIVAFENTYTFQIMSNQADIDEKARALIEQSNEISYGGTLPFLQIEAPEEEVWTSYYMVVSYSDLQQLAADTGLEFTLKEPQDDTMIELENMPMLSLVTKQENITKNISGKTYRRTELSRVPYLGYLQESMECYVVNEAEYARLLPLGEQLYTYNYRIADLTEFAQVRDSLDVLVSNTEENYTARIAIDPENSDIDWLKILYSLCIFVFMVFVVAGGCIMFMKLYNDAQEEKARYLILQKLGLRGEILRKSIAQELRMAYGIPFVVMAVSSYFSVRALAKMMFTNLFAVNVVSVLVIFGIFLVCYEVSVVVYRRNVGVG